MRDKISRRDFLKLTGVGAAAGMALTGCGTNARVVRRITYREMPEYTLPGRFTYYATTCGECPAGCGTIVKTVEGRAIKVEGNPQHPVNRGRTCSRGQTSLHGLYNPDRYATAVHQPNRGSGNFEDIAWEEALEIVTQALQRQNSSELGFIAGLVPDHLADLWREIAAELGIPDPLRFTGLAMLEERNTLAQACETVFGVRALPHFDIADADIIFSFGADFASTWLTPVSYSLAYGEMRQGDPNRRGYLVHFEPRLSLTAANADEWFPIAPGSEALLAGALGMLIQEIRGSEISPAYRNLDLNEVSGISGVPFEDMERLARLFADPDRSALAIPGSVAMGNSNGQRSAEAILALNGLVSSFGRGGISFLPDNALGTDPTLSSTLEDVAAFVNRMNAGGIKVLFIHNTNPVFELPPEIGFTEALENVPLVISFSPFPNETTLLSDYVFPDHTPLESWGYQYLQVGTEVRAISGFQPVVTHFRNTRSTVDLFLAAIQQTGGSLASNLPFADEVAYIQDKVVGLNGEGGFYSAPENNTFWTLWQQVGGWWQQEPGLQVPVFDAQVLDDEKALSNAEFTGGGDYPFHLLVYPSTHLTDGSGANRPWLQETPDPMTTAMWDTWVEINMATARELGLHNNDIVRLVTPAGEITAIVYLYPAIRPDVIAIPTGQGHNHFGIFATGIGSNPFKILPVATNQAGDLAYMTTRVRIEKTGKTKELARKESVKGVYGEEAAIGDAREEIP